VQWYFVYHLTLNLQSNPRRQEFEDSDQSKFILNVSFAHNSMLIIHKTARYLGSRFDNILADNSNPEIKSLHFLSICNNNEE
jgi:hypothetical protein